MPGVQSTIQLFDVWNRKMLGVLLEELLAVDAFRATQQCHRTLVQIRQNPFGNRRVELRKFDLAGAGLAVDHPIRRLMPVPSTSTLPLPAAVFLPERGAADVDCVRVWLATLAG